VTSFTLIGNHQLKELSRKLAAAANGVELRRNLRANLREAAKPAIDEMKTRILAMDVKGVRGGGRKRRAQFNAARRLRGGAGLRATVARGVKLELRTTGRDVVARIFVDNSHMPRSQRNLPSHLDNPRGWRHPRFGHKGAGDWFQQFGEPYFDVTIRRHRRSLERAARRAAADVVGGLR
jgi:hypothetical protein